MGSRTANGHSHTNGFDLRYIDLPYDPKNSSETAKELVYRIYPEWRDTPDEIEIFKFTDGITNTLFKLARRNSRFTQDEIDRESVLMRAYGNHTEILIDRDREALSHALCARYGLAPPLLARFRNGLLYRYVPGSVCTAKDLIQEETWRMVARRLGEWHARLPIESISPRIAATNGTHYMNGHASSLAARTPVPNIWSVMQKWIQVLPTITVKQQARKALLQQELERSFAELDTTEGPGREGMVFGHCDLLCANVIKTQAFGEFAEPEVAFIDYEYAVPCPAAFDIANHFAEWGGYDCDYYMLPTRSVRHDFLKEYLSSYQMHNEKHVPSSMLDFLEEEVDRYRGMPGLYWGIWALIQATISQIDFDYASYAEIRLGEYFAWREHGQNHISNGSDLPLRERRWAQP